MSPTQLPAWQALSQHAQTLCHQPLSQLFAQDADRFNHFCVRQQTLLLDFSRQRVNQTTLTLLKQLADQCQLSTWITRLFTGEPINDSEKRPALHTALRQPASDTLALGQQDIIADVHYNLDHMQTIVERIQAGQWRGYSGQPIDTIVNIGVGGSDLGPMMACQALADFHTAHSLKLHFVSTMDGSQLAGLLSQLRPESTLFIISSKSFTTVDTLANANTARQWLRQASGVRDELLHRRHFIGVSAHPQRMSQWGIPAKSQLRFWPWVGGRYSLWSCIGLPVALCIGMHGFRQLLAGAHQLDQHFCSAPFEQNLPMLMAMLGIWNINFLQIHAHAILPYDGRLKHLPAYLEQLEMESNGKSVNRRGEPVNYRTCPVLWGDIGPNAQHAFYQMLHQGTEPVMCDFIAPARRYQGSDNPALQQQQTLTLANCLAQAHLLAMGAEPSQHSHLNHRGNQPCNVILLDELTPHTLGQLVALYEHKVFVQSVIWNINPFDQWGVEQGKKIATHLLPALQQRDSGLQFDSATQGLLSVIAQLQAGRH